MVSRIRAVDYLKAIGIIAVVCGHAKLPEWILRWIHTFHIPMFFMISGSLITPESLPGNFRTFFKKRIVKLFYSYLFFWAIGAVFYLLKNAPDASPANRILSLLYSSGTAEGDICLYPIVLWFFPALIFGMCFLYLVTTINSRILQWTAAAAFTGTGYAAGSLALPWELESAACSTIFLYSGYRFSHKLREDAMDPESLSPSWLGLPLIVAGALMLVFHPNIGFSLRVSNFGSPLLSFTCFVITASGLYLLTRKLPRSKVVEAVSRGTIIIFPLHMIVFLLIDVFMQRIGMERLTNTIAYATGKCAITIVFLTLVSIYLLRMLKPQSGSGSSGQPASA